MIATLGLSAFFLLLTVLPLLDPVTISCPVPSAAPQLRPFEFVRHVAQNWRWGPQVALLSQGPLSALANLLLCVAIGLAFRRAGGMVRGAVLLGAGLSLVAELGQLTALWGLYPCPIRQFDVDDLILNVGGVVIGAWLGWGRPRPVDDTGRLPDGPRR